MKSAEWLKHAPKRVRERLERHPAVVAFVAGGRDWTGCLTDETVLHKLMGTMSETERSVLRSIVRHCSFMPFSDTELDKIRPRDMSGAEARVGLLALRQAGLVITMKKMWGERLYMLPRDSCEVWLRLLFPCPETFEGGDEPAGEAAVEHVRIRGIADKLFRLLVYADQFGLPLTTKGTIPKRIVKDLTTQLGDDDEALLGMPIRYVHDDAYPVQLAVVLDLALRIGLLRRCPERTAYLIDQEALGDWLACEGERRNRELYNLWLDVHMPKEVWLQHAASYISALPPEKRVSLENVDRWLENIGPHDMPPDRNERLQRLIKEWIVPLDWLGRILIGKDASGRFFVQQAAALPEADELFVQDHFELIAPPGLTFASRWEMERFAELVQDDEVSVYRITKTSVWKACERGMSAERITALLDRCSAYAVPDHIKEAIEDWCGRFGRVTLSDVRLLRAADKRIADLIAGHPELAPWIAARLHELDFIVHPGDHERLVHRLKAMGLAPQMQVQPSSAASVGNERPTDLSEEKQTANPHAEEAVVYTAACIPAYELDRDIPDIRSLYPELDRIPGVWLHEPRAYHISTGKELVSKAIEWKAYVRLKNGGTEWRIAPYKLVNEQGEWTVIGNAGQGEMQVRSKLWQEMQLILPGINDKT